MTKRTVRVTFSGSFTYDIDDTSDDFEMYYGSKFVNVVDIESVRSTDANLPFLIEHLLEVPDSFKFELNWADEVN